MLGKGDEGVTDLRQGLAAYQETGALMERPYYLGLLAEACGATGRTAEGLAAVDEALAMIPAGRSFFYEAELHRLRGVLLLQDGAHAARLSEVDMCFRRALEVATRQQAGTLRERVVRSLTDLSR